MEVSSSRKSHPSRSKFEGTAAHLPKLKAMASTSRQIVVQVLHHVMSAELSHKEGLQIRSSQFAFLPVNVASAGSEQMYDAGLHLKTR